jgi:predicted dinucleotide-binding enzyme
MKIGILGTGHIGRTLALRLPEAGHEVKVANSRGPQAIGQHVLATGARAVTAADAVADVDVVIVSVPLGRLLEIAPLVRDLPDDVVVIDTMNYYPTRDGAIEALDGGQVESAWVAQQLGRPVVKAWNSIGSDSLASKGQPAGTPGRIALPVAADGDEARRIGMRLVEETGFDAFDAGTLAESWRHQPGTPPYCTDLTRGELAAALAAADVERAPRRRDLATAVVTERMGDASKNPDADYFVRLNRVLYM